MAEGEKKGGLLGKILIVALIIIVLSLVIYGVVRLQKAKAANPSVQPGQPAPSPSSTIPVNYAPQSSSKPTIQTMLKIGDKDPPGAAPEDKIVYTFQRYLNRAFKGNFEIGYDKLQKAIATDGNFGTQTQTACQDILGKPTGSVAQLYDKIQQINTVLFYQGKPAV